MNAPDGIKVLPEDQFSFFQLLVGTFAASADASCASQWKRPPHRWLEGRLRLFSLYLREFSRQPALSSPRLFSRWAFARTWGQRQQRDGQWLDRCKRRRRPAAHSGLRGVLSQPWQGGLSATLQSSRVAAIFGTANRWALNTHREATFSLDL